MPQNDVVSHRLTILMTNSAQGEEDVKHLHIILNNPCKDFIGNRDDIVLITNFTSADEFIPDPTCVFDAGCHPFIIRKSCIHYRHTRMEPAYFVENGVISGKFIKKEIIDREIYNTVIKGLFKSKSVPLKYQRFLKSAIEQGACPDIDEE